LRGPGFLTNVGEHHAARRAARTEAVVSFNGGRLTDAKEILLYSPGVTVSKLQVVNDGQVKATIK